MRKLAEICYTKLHSYTQFIWNFHFLPTNALFSKLKILRFFHFDPQFLVPSPDLEIEESALLSKVISIETKEYA